MPLSNLSISKNWFTATTVREINWDAIRSPVITWATNVNLAFQQVTRDAFGSSYNIDNTGSSQLSISLQDQINLLISGGSAVLGTTNASWTIYLGSAGRAILDTTGLTGIRTFTFPDLTGQITTNNGTQTLINKTLTTPIITGAGVGLATIQYANSASSRTETIPDTGVNDTFVLETYGKARLLNPGYINNGRLTLSGGVLKLVGDDGNDPSATNPVVFRVPSSTNGKWDYVVFTAATHCTINDDANADSYFDGGGGVPFGTTAAVAWGNDRPFALYVATDGTTPVLFLSPNPCAITTPLAAGIGYKDTPPATPADTNFFAFTATNVTVTHASKKCLLVGSIRMTKSASDDWTITALDSGDGIGNFKNYNGRTFSMVASQMGANSGSYFNTAGTAPTYTANSIYVYKLDLKGILHIEYNFLNTAGGTAGAGGGLAIYLATPFITTNNAGKYGGVVYILNNGSIESNGFNSIYYSITPYTMLNFFYQGTIKTAIAPVYAVDQNNAVRSLSGIISFKAFDS